MPELRPVPRRGHRSQVARARAKATDFGLRSRSAPVSAMSCRRCRLPRPHWQARIADQEDEQSVAETLVALD